MEATIPYRVTGHESFACRYTWLPKIVKSLKRDRHLFTNEQEAMVELGVGKNMVRSMRYWAQSSGVAVASGRNEGHSLTQFATSLLDDERGLDPYLEDIRTLWLIHWRLATNPTSPLLAWDYLVNRWHEPELTEAAAVEALRLETIKNGDDLSLTTLTSHFQVFLHTYISTRGRTREIQEDNLDCPLVELEFIIRRGERGSDGKREPIYCFNRDWKPEITQELFVYALNSFWQERHVTEHELSLRQIAHGHGSHGQVFKLPEDDIRLRLENLNKHSQSPFSYSESINVQKVTKRNDYTEHQLLGRIYN